MTGSFKCPKCGTSTWGEEKFCSCCGQPLWVLCDHCGATWRFFWAYKFCQNCGTKVPAVPSSPDFTSDSSKTGRGH